MKERINHVAEATRLLENYAPDYTAAQVHATLALVEEQHIANLIAYMDGWATHDVPAEEMMRMREGLGLS